MGSDTLTIQTQEELRATKFSNEKLKDMWWKAGFAWQAILAFFLLAATGRMAVSFVYLLSLQTLTLTGVFALAGFACLAVIWVADFFHAVYSGFKQQYETAYYQKMANGEKKLDFKTAYPRVNARLKTLKPITLLQNPFRAIIGIFAITLLLSGSASLELFVASIVMGAGLGMYITKITEKQNQKRDQTLADLEADYREHRNVSKPINTDNDRYIKSTPAAWRAFNKYDAGFALLFAFGLALRPAGLSSIFSDNVAWLHDGLALSIILPVTGAIFIADVCRTFFENWKKEYAVDAQRAKNLDAFEGGHGVDLETFAQAHPIANMLHNGLRKVVEPLYVATSLIFLTLIGLMLGDSLGTPLFGAGPIAALFNSEPTTQLFRVCLTAGFIGIAMGLKSANAKREHEEAMENAKHDYLCTVGVVDEVKAPDYVAPPSPKGDDDPRAAQKGLLTFMHEQPRGVLTRNVELAELGTDGKYRKGAP